MVAAEMRRARKEEVRIKRALGRRFTSSHDEPWYLRLKRAREQQGLSQKELAKLCGWLDKAGEGAQSRISNYENGTREPTLSDIAALASHVKVHPTELAYGRRHGTLDHVFLLLVILALAA